MNMDHLENTPHEQDQTLQPELASTPVGELTAQELEQQKFLEKLAREGKRVISFNSAPADSKKKIDFLMGELEDLRNYLINAQESISEKNNQIIGKIATLKTNKYFPPSADVSQIFEKTAQDYAHLIKRSLLEIDIRKDHCMKYLNGTTRYIIAPLGENSPMVDLLLIAHHIEQEILTIRAFIKQERKNLAVFFSRYEHGFRIHMQHITQIEYQLNTIATAQ